MNEPFLAEIPCREPNAHLKLCKTSLERFQSDQQRLTIAEKVARVSGVRAELDRSRKRRDTSKRVTASRPQERQMDTALVDQADWKLILGPTCMDTIFWAG